MTSQHKAVALISGGLDSMLAAKAILQQGIHVEGINFYTGFCHSGHTSAIRNQNKNSTKPKRNDALWVAEQLRIKLHIIDIVEEYKSILTTPRFGYGQNLNPCLDCKVFMVKKAQQWMIENQFDFIITGEVIGQRPMSQRKATMPVVANQSGASDRLLRPLCAKLLEPTLPEREGWVDREKLFNFSGRSRKPQFDLAERFEISEFSQPAGGCCVLTDENYSRKLADMWQHRGKKEYSLDDIILLKVGRHIRLKPHYKLIIGRDEGENNFLEGYKHQFIYLQAISHMGPLMLIEGEPTSEEIIYSARILARFGAGRDDLQVKIEYVEQTGEKRELNVAPLSTSEISESWYV